MWVLAPEDGRRIGVGAWTMASRGVGGDLMSTSSMHGSPHIVPTLHRARLEKYRGMGST